MPKVKSPRDYLSIVQITDCDTDVRKDDSEFATAEIKRIPDNAKLYYAEWEGEHIGYVWRTSYVDGLNNWVGRVKLVIVAHMQPLILNCQANRLDDLLNTLAYRIAGWKNGKIDIKTHRYTVDDPKPLETDEEENEL
jgi:hypothetical protein